MEFIIDNLVWFIVGGVVILMTIIGYFAEKTDFGKNLSSKNNEDEELVEPKKEKHAKKIKPTKKGKEADLVDKKEEILQSQPVEEQLSSELPIPVINAAPVALEEQNVEPVAIEPIETTVVNDIPTEVSANPATLEEQNVEPVAIEPIETTVVNDIPTEVSANPATLEEQEVQPVTIEPIENVDVENIPTEINNVPVIQEAVPVDLQSTAIEDNNIEIQPALEAEPIPQIFSEPVAEIPTIENVVPDELPTISEEVDNNNPTVQLNNATEEPIGMPIALPDSINQENDAQQMSVVDEKPVVITDEKVVPFDELAGNMDVSPIAIEQGIPALNMELPNLETVVQDNAQSEEEDIWKF